MMIGLNGASNHIVDIQMMHEVDEVDDRDR